MRAATTARSTSAWPASPTTGSTGSPRSWARPRPRRPRSASWTCPGTGAQLLGNLRQTDAILAVLDGFSANADPERRPRDARARAAGRRSRPRRAPAGAGPQGSEVRRSGQARGARAARAAAPARGGGQAARARPASCRPSWSPLTTKPLIPIVNGPQDSTRKLEAELAELPEDEAEAFRDGRPSALADGRPAAEGRAGPDHLLHGRRQGGARLDAPPRPDRARGGGVDPHRHRPRLHPRGGDPLGRPRAHRLARAGRGAGLAAAGRQGATSSQDGDVLNVRFNI